MPKDNQEYVIGVDGGGTKTIVALADFNGKILKIAQSGPSNLRNLGIKKSVNNIVRGLTKLLSQKKKIKIDSTFIGLPALEEEFKTKKDNIKREILRYKEISVLSQGEVILGSDQLVAFRSGSDKKDGIVLIAGTGCVAHGWRKRKEAKASGWGWLADEGSSFWIGQKVYQVVLKGLDGRGSKNLLKKIVFQKFRMKENANLLNKLIYSEEPNKAIAPLSIICDKAAKKGDRIAKHIMREAAKELALSANTAIRKLNFQKVKFPLVLIGGVFKSKIVLDTVKKRIKRIAPKVNFIRPKAEPVVGAVKLALEAIKDGED